MDGEPTITATCVTEGRPHEVIEAAQRVAREHEFASAMTGREIAGRVWLNWRPEGDLYTGARVLAPLLEELGCESVAYQLESGAGSTLPPG